MWLTCLCGIQESDYIANRNFLWALKQVTYSDCVSHFSSPLLNGNIPSLHRDPVKIGTLQHLVLLQAEQIGALLGKI